MQRAESQTLRKWTLLRRLTAGACFGAPLLVAGCMQFPHSKAVMAGRVLDKSVTQACYRPGQEPVSGVVTGGYQVAAQEQGSQVVPAGTVVGETKPASRMVAAAPRGGAACNYGTAPSITHLPEEQPGGVPPTTPPIAMPDCSQDKPSTPAVLPVGLDTVFRLAEDQNFQVAIAREKVREAYADKKVAAARWLPDLWVGTAYYRHEGGIQDFTGNLIKSSYGSMFAGMEMNSQFDVRDFAYQKVNAQRKVWQEKGELAKVTNETMLEAANAYIDLLSARNGEAIAREMEIDLKELLKRAESLASQEKAAEIEVDRIKSELAGQQQAATKLRMQAEAASAKLAYLLGVDPCTEMIPVDAKLMPLELVDASPACCTLVQQALVTGPGVQEMEGLLGLIHEAMDKAQGPTRLMPVLGVRMAEGGFGAGPGSTSTWDNRWDLGLQARWNLTEYVTARSRRCAAMARMQQAHLAYQDLKNKLAAGVQASRAEVLGGHEQILLGQKQIEGAKNAHEKSLNRLKLNVPGSSHSEVLLAIRTVALAQLNYLTAINAYDKAQVRLLVLLGPTAPECRVLPCSQ